MNPLTSVSPIDGRYNKSTRHLSEYFSEYALFKFRLEVEVEYFIFLYEKLEGRKIPDTYVKDLRFLYKNFNLIECEKVKKFENKCNHDVKAVEYYLSDKLKEIGMYKFSYLIHFGLTSQDINNTAITMSIRDYIFEVYIPRMEDILNDINEKSEFYKNVTMMTRTHGQPAVPSTMGKELRVFHYRISKQFEMLRSIKYYGKFGGAVGNLNAHYLAYPDINWSRELSEFVDKQLGLTREEYTTQIDNYENLAIIFDNLRRINTIFIDFNRDIWQYISMEYFIQEYNTCEVGSSTMPQKINPIKFENSEGNLMVASSLLDFLSNKLPISRLQRDLTDSTVLRNLGTIFGHIDIALKNFKNGFSKINVNPIKLNEDLNSHLEIVTEGIQTLLRREGHLDAYEQVKLLARNNEKLTYDDIHRFIQTIEVSQDTKCELYNLTPLSYIGITKNL